MAKEFIEKINKYLFFTLLVIFAVTYISRNNLRSVSEIAPAILEQPRQTSATGPSIIELKKYGHVYEITPLYNYEINAMVASKMYYRLVSNEAEKIAPVDLCLVWGENIANKVHKNKAIKISQSGRWYWVNWRGDVVFNFNDIANNHLVLSKHELERKIKTIVAGDQVNIKGKLVNIAAFANNKPKGNNSPPQFSWNTSTTRADTGAGSCEIIYVEDIQILKKANVLSYYLFIVSLYGLLVLAGLNIVRFFIVPVASI